jgi:glycosyltransferase
MKISVVTAVWNRAVTIGQAIESVQEQTYANVGHVI